MKQLFTTKLSTSRRLSLTVLALAAATAIQAATITLTVKDTRKQTITGFGAAC
mgnify:CR=1 FL=1